MRARRQLVDGAQLDDAAVRHLALALFAVAENLGCFGVDLCVLTGGRWRGAAFNAGRAVKREEFFRAELLFVRLRLRAGRKCGKQAEQ